MKGKNSFSVDDIHKVREEIYEKTKDLSPEELIKYVNDNANEVRKKISKNRKRKIAI